jgi:hypothetical protein
MSFNLKITRHQRKLFCCPKKSSKHFLLFSVFFFSLHCGQKLEYFFLFLSTEFIVRHWLRGARGGVFRNNKRADAGGYHIFFLKLNML